MRRALLAVPLLAVFGTCHQEPRGTAPQPQPQPAAMDPPLRQELEEALATLRREPADERALAVVLPHLRELLREGGWRADAAAHLCGAHGRAECAPELVAALERLRPEDSQRGARSADLLIDAMIRIGANAPVDSLLPHYAPERGAMLYVAIASEPDPWVRADGLLALVDRSSPTDPAHHAAACRLAAVRDPRLPPRLLVAEPIELRFAVRDRGSEEWDVPITFEVEWCTGIASCGTRWPPQPLYALELRGVGRRLDQITHRRSESGTMLSSFQNVLRDERIEWRARILREYLGDDPDLALGVDECTAHHGFADAPLLDAALRRHVDAVRRRVAWITHALARGGCAGNVERLLREVRYRVHVVDLRGDRSTPLPEPRAIADVEFAARDEDR